MRGYWWESHLHSYRVALDATDIGIIASFVAGSQSSYMLLESERVFACDRNDVGQLGDGTLDDSFGTFVSRTSITDLAAGSAAKSAFFYSTNGRLFGTGLNDRGQLGVGNRINSNVPVEVDLGGSVNIEGGVSASISHTLAW